MIGLNNPLNIRCGRKYWIGQTGVCKGFCDFGSLEYCIRAWLYLCLVSYPRVLGSDMTVSQFIHRYCPVGDGNNDPGYYVNFVCSPAVDYSSNRRIKFQPDSIISLFDKLELYIFCFNMCQMESSFYLSKKYFFDVYEKCTFVENRS